MTDKNTRPTRRTETNKDKFIRKLRALIDNFDHDVPRLELAEELEREARILRSIGQK